MHELGVAALYSAVDSQLTHYAVDVAAGTLDVGESVELPAKVQYAWPHPKNNILYVATSSGGPGVRSHRNQVNAFLIAADGSLKPHGEPRLLPRRAVHLCVDPAGQSSVPRGAAPAPLGKLFFYPCKTPSEIVL